MSRNVPFEDPLLHPPTPPIAPKTAIETQQDQAQQQQHLHTQQVDDGPIPFQSSSSADTSAVFSPPPFPAQSAAAVATPPLVAKATPDFVDPLTAAALEDQDGHGHSRTSIVTESRTGTERIGSSSTVLQAPSPNISIPANNNSMPTEFPTHLASPPIPQKPLSIGDTTFSAFQTFSSALEPSMTSGTSVPTIVSGSGVPQVGEVPNLRPDSSLSAHSQESPLSAGLGFGAHDGQGLGSDTAAGQQRHQKQWAQQQSTVISTHPSRLGLQDHSDMERQDLKSPEQETSINHPFHGTPGASSFPDEPLHTGTQSNAQLHIRPVAHGREHSVGIRSPVFAVPQSPMRQEGLPVLNSHSMFHEITMPDAMNDLMIKHVPAEQRVLRDWNTLTEAEQRQASRAEILHELTINNSWRAMARYTRAQILATPSERIPDLINFWYARLLALIKLGQYEMAQAELEQLGDLRGPQFRYENYPPEMFAHSDLQTKEQQRNGTLKKGSMVPFELLVLKARLQGYLGDIYEAIDQLYDLIMHCKKFEAICRVSGDRVGVRQWQEITGQLHLMVLNYLVELKDYSTATKHGRDLARKYAQDVNFHSGLGRLYLQLGDIERAEEVFKQVEDMVQGQHTSATDGQSQEQGQQQHFKLQLIMNRALLAVTQGQWQAAKSAFEEVLAQEPENLAATNNLAVCELYAGQLNESIPRLERLMFAYPTSAGTSEPLVFNMATLYELRTEGSQRKKQQMMVEVSKWAGDQFNVGMFKS